jgi:TonB-dependent SusC/RagA subfamily outer membrane receptor
MMQMTMVKVSLLIIYTNPLALINVQDIDNITVLKDASSIYGVKGANGAILITTARANQQATRIDASAYTGINQFLMNYLL